MAFLVVVDLIVLIIVFLAGAVFAVLEAVDALFTTVVVLPSLDSLVTLTFRLPRVAPVDGGATPALRARPVAVVAVFPALELAVDEVVIFLVAAAGRVPLALSTMLERMFEEALPGGTLTGDPGRLIVDFMGEVGRSLGRTRVFEDVGERTCEAVMGAAACMTAPRTLFLGLSKASPWFSLSAPETSLLRVVSSYVQQSHCKPHLNSFCPRTGLAGGSGFREIGLGLGLGLGLGDVPSLAGTGGGLFTYWDLGAGRGRCG